MRKTINGSPGLQTAPNTEVVPPGALKQAYGCAIRRPGLTDTLRPLTQLYLGQQKFPNFAGAWLASYGGYLYIGNNTATIWTDNGFASVTAPVACAPADGFAMRYIEANGNLYLNTANGSVKLDSVSGTPYRAGIPRALDMQLSLVASGTKLANTNSIGYRALFGIKDANGNLILGPPSGRATITATGSQDVSVKVWIPSALTSAANATSYFVQVYATTVQTTAGVDPGEEMQVVYQATLTSTDVSNKFVSFTDNTPDGLRGAQGYFCPSQEGLDQANYPPPIAKDVALFRGGTFYANTTQKHTARLQLLGISKNLLTISTGAGGITKSGGSGIYTFTGSPDLSNIPTDGSAKLSSTGNTSAGNNGEFVITAVDNAAKTITVTNAGAVTEAGTANSRGWPSKLTIAGVNYYGSINGTENAASQVFKVATAGTAQQNVADTSASLLRVLNQQSSPVVYGYYESGADDGAGEMLFEGVSLGGSQFTISAAGTLLYNSFNPTIPGTAAVTSANDAAIHRLYYSKQDEPEHVPLDSYFDIGSRLKAILRIIPLREALLVFKEDGVFRVTGDGAGNWIVAPLDYAVKGVHRLAICSLGNRAYCFTVRGIAIVNETGTRIISIPISDKISKVTEAFGTNVYISWVSELDQNVFFYVTGVDSVTYIYNAITDTWTQTYADPDPNFGTSYYKWSAPILHNGLSTSIIGSVRADIWQESLSSITQDSNLLKLPMTGSDVGASTITVDKTMLQAGFIGNNLKVGAVVGARLGGNLNLMNITAIDASVPSATVVTLTPNAISPNASVIYLTNDGTYIWLPQNMVVEFAPYTAGDEADADSMTEVAIVLDPSSTLTTCTVNMYTEATTSTQVASMTSTNTPLPTGISTQTLVRAIVPTTMRHCRRLSVVFSHSTAGEYVAIRGISYKFNPLDGPAKELA